MAAKFDKEVLIKHHFWILMGLFTLLILIAMLGLATGVSGSIEKKEKDLESAKAKLKAITNPKNQKWLDKGKEKDSKIVSKRDSVWEAAWKTQSDLMTWPDAFKDKFGPLYMGDDMDPYERERFAHQDVGYATQLPQVVAVVQPLVRVGGKEEGAVQFNGDWNSVLDLVKTFEKKTPPVKEDIWLAQEDLWVKREMLRIVREANDMVAVFQEVRPPAPKQAAPPAPAKAAEEKKDADDSADSDKKEAKPVPPPPPPPPVDPLHRVYRNPFWELDLKIGRNDKGQFTVGGKLKNIGRSKQSRGMNFKVYLEPRAPESAVAILPVDGLPMAVGESADIPEIRLQDRLRVEGFFGLEQVLTWKTAPVKRIDRVEMGYNSSRSATFVKALKPPNWVKKEEADPATADPAGVNNNPMMQGQGPKMGFGGSGQSSNATPNGFRLDRYSDTNDQVRHMPVAMVVIVEEEHIPTFLTAFENSRLRIQPTQYHWARSREKLTPPGEEESPSGVSSGASNPAGPKLTGGGNKNLGQLLGGLSPANRVVNAGGGQGPPRLPGGNPLMGGGSAEDEADEEMNLVEVSVYGIASLYEKYPPKPEQAEKK